MVYGLGISLHACAHASLDAFSTQFQGRVFSLLTESVHGDRMTQVAKVIASLAVIIFALIAIAACIVCCQYEEVTVTYSDIPSSTLSEPAEKPEERVKEGLESPASTTFESSIDTDLPDSFPLPKEVPLIPKSTGVKKQYDLPALENVATLNLIDDTTKAQLSQKLMKAYDLIKEANDLLGLFASKIPDSIKNDINLLGTFDGETQKYEEIAIQLSKLTDGTCSLWGGVHKSHIEDLLTQVRQDHLPLVFFASCQKYFNEGNFDQCASTAKMISDYRSVVKGTIAFALCRQYIHRLECDKALAQAHSKEDRMHIAKMFFNAGNYAQALKAAEASSYGLVDREEQDAFILNIGKIYLENNELDKAHQVVVAQGLSALDENNREFLCDIAKAYIRQTPPDLEKALKIAKDLFSKERDELLVEIIKKYLGQGDLGKALDITKDALFGLTRQEWYLIIAKAHFNQGNWKKAAQIAREMNYSEERNDFIMTIVKKYISKDDLETALQLAQDLPRNDKTDKLILQIAHIHLTQKNDIETASKIAKKLLETQQTNTFMLQIAEKYLAQQELEKALNIATDHLTYMRKEREAFILKVARAYYQSGERATAIKIAEDLDKRSYNVSSERKQLIQQMKQGATI